MNIDTAIGDKNCPSQLFTINLIDKENNLHSIEALGVDRIAGPIEKVNVDGVREIFSSDIQCMWDVVGSRPSGEVELLIGNNYLGLHPTELEASGNIKVLKSRFGTGFVLSGSHPALQSLQPTHSNVSNVHSTKLTYKSVRDYLDANELQVEAPRRCNNCLNCNDCTF